MMPGRSGRPRWSTGTTEGHWPVRPRASTGCRGPSWPIRPRSADSAALRQRAASCSAHSSRGICVPSAHRVCPAGWPARPNAAARAPEVPTSTATSTSPGLLIAGTGLRPAACWSAANQLVGLDLVPVEHDQRAVQSASGVVAARVEDHCAAQPAYPGRLVDVAVQAQQRLALGDQVAHGGTADGDVLHLAEHRLNLQAVIELGCLVKLGAVRRYMQVVDGALGPG